MKLQQARVLLTGATGGIGQTLAAALTGAGAAVLLVGRSPARLTAQVRALLAGLPEQAASRIAWHAADLACDADFAPLARAGIEWNCNVVIHNAGVPAFGRLECLNTDLMAQVLQLNLMAPMRLTQALVPHLHTQAQAHIVFMGSVLGRLGLPGYSVYSASKFGLRGFAESLRRELGDSHIRVQYLGPRSTRTQFNSDSVTAFNQATGTATDSPEVVARALLEILDSGAAERFIGFPESLAVRINGVAPSLLDGAFAAHRRHLPSLSCLAEHPSADEPLAHRSS